MRTKSRSTLSLPKTAIGFKSEFLDFQRGIRVGNLEDSERITRILKLALGARYGQEFVTERWGRGVFWQWIGYLPRANRNAKPISSNVSFGCSKFFIMVDTGERVFKCGMQVERGYQVPPAEYTQCRLQSDWDWHRLMAALKPSSPLDRELKRLVTREGFRIHAGGWDAETPEINRNNFHGAAGIRHALRSAPGDRWQA
jgi:hypothetical protein